MCLCDELSGNGSFVAASYTVRQQDVVYGTLAHLAGSFRNWVGGSVQVAVCLNSAQIFSAVLDQFSTQANFATSSFVRVGDKISFVVGSVSGFADISAETAVRANIGISGNFKQNLFIFIYF